MQSKINGDCGIYVIKYAEYFINSMLKEMPKTFNIAQIRKYLATELYVYAKKKQVENYDTDNDWFHVNEINNVVFEGFFAKDSMKKVAKRVEFGMLLEESPITKFGSHDGRLPPSVPVAAGGPLVSGESLEDF
ncbi:Ulp1 protease family [Forsythia ovata]|uniref:Ulp1 protease family n=1 Tax=Forsythia ovata TaxID=205694 RepID=A0ABD1VLJ1_9LAMI